MHPQASTTGRLIFAGSITLLAAGVVTSTPALIAIASAGALLLAWSYIDAVPMARRARREKLEFAWWLERSHVQSGAVVPGVPFEVRCYLRNRGPHPIQVSGFGPEIASPQAEAVAGPSTLLIPSQSRVSFRFAMRAQSAGRLNLHGFALHLASPLGLFTVRLYFPNPLSVRVLPQSSAALRPGSRLTTGIPTESARLALARRRGSGMELHELRDLLPGDSYRSIAWKASGRLGKWLVKEVEQEVQNTLWLIVDISGTMRQGNCGHRLLDRAIEWAAANADFALQHGGRVGLITYDGRLVSVVDAGEGASHRLRIYEALLDATEVVDADLTEEDGEAVAKIVARHLRQQRGVTLRSEKQGSNQDLTDIVSRYLEDEIDPTHANVIQAASHNERVLRAFCRQHGLALTHRREPQTGRKALALQSALLRAAGRRRDPALMHVFTDFAAMGSPEPVTQALRFLRGRHHRVEFSLPPAPSQPRDIRGMDSAEQTLEYRRAERRRREAYRLLLPLGTRVSTLPFPRSESSASV